MDGFIGCLIVGLNPKLPDFMLPKKKKSAAVKPAAGQCSSQEPVPGTSTGGQTSQGNLRKRMKTSSAPSSPPSSDDGDSDWEPEKERNVKPAKKQPAARAGNGRGSGKD